MTIIVIIILFLIILYVNYLFYISTKNIEPKKDYLVDIINNQNKKIDELKKYTVDTRDRQVINDTLYPPISRTERPQYDILLNYMSKRPDLFNYPTRGSPDTYRQIGYLTTGPSKNPDDILILYGREKYKGSDLGEFYITSANKFSGLKFMLNNTNSNVKRLYDIPQKINITGNILAGTYDYTELPKPDLTSPPYI